MYTRPNNAQDAAHGSKGQMIASMLRERIVSGHYGVAEKLPTFDEFVAEFAVSRGTMQQAIRRLSEDGFLTSVNRSGLFVVGHPPHTHRFAVLFPCVPGDAEWHRFFANFHAACAVVSRKLGHFELVPFFGLSGPHSEEAMQTLFADVAAHRLAGLIVHRSTEYLLDLEPIKSSRIPAVLINFEESHARGLPTVNTDADALVSKSLRWLHGQGRRRLAAVTIQDFKKLTLDRVRDVGFSSRPQWLCTTGRDFRPGIRTVIRLLLDYPAEERIDALFIANDNLVEEVLATIHECGLTVGRDIDVAAHTNWPWVASSPVPVARIGFQVDDFITMALDTFERLRHGRPVSRLQLVPALLEDEVLRRNVPAPVHPFV